MVAIPNLGKKCTNNLNKHNIILSVDYLRTGTVDFIKCTSRYGFDFDEYFIAGGFFASRIKDERRQPFSQLSITIECHLDFPFTAANHHRLYSDACKVSFKFSVKYYMPMYYGKMCRRENFKVGGKLNLACLHFNRKWGLQGLRGNRCDEYLRSYVFKVLIT